MLFALVVLKEIELTVLLFHSIRKNKNPKKLRWNSEVILTYFKKKTVYSAMQYKEGTTYLDCGEQQFEK